MCVHRRGRADRLRPGRGDRDDQPHVPAVAHSERAGATASLPSARSPRAISTKPPKIERAAEPEPTPRQHRQLGRPTASARPRASPPARAPRSPDADDASPAAVGTLFSLVTHARGARRASCCRRARARDRGTRTRARLSRRRRARRRARCDPSRQRRIAVERDRRARPQPIERQRQAAGGRQVQRGVALAPVLHQRDVGPARGRGDGTWRARHGVAAPVRRTSVAAMPAMKPSKPAALPAREHVALVAGRERDHRAAAARAGQLGADGARGARARGPGASSSGVDSRSAASRPCATSNDPSQAVDVARAASARPPSSVSSPSVARMPSATGSRSRSRATAATCAAVSRGRPDSPTHSGSPGARPPAASRPRARTVRRRRSPPRPRRCPDGLPWKTVSASATAASDRRVARRAPASRRPPRAPPPPPAPPSCPARRATGSAASTVEIQRRRLQPAHDRRQRAPDLRCRRRPSPSSPHAGTRSRPLPGARRRRDARPTSPRPARGWPYTTACSPTQDHLAVAEALTGWPCAPLVGRGHTGRCASHCASSPVITRGAAARSRARPTPHSRAAVAHAVDHAGRGTPRPPRARPRCTARSAGCASPPSRAPSASARATSSPLRMPPEATTSSPRRAPSRPPATRPPPPSGCPSPTARAPRALSGALRRAATRPRSTTCRRRPTRRWRATPASLQPRAPPPARCRSRSP